MWRVYAASSSSSCVPLSLCFSLQYNIDTFILLARHRQTLLSSRHSGNMPGMVDAESVELLMRAAGQAHNDALSRHRNRLKEQCRQVQADLDSLQNEMAHLETSPTHSIIAQLRESGDRQHRLQLAYDYLLLAIRIDELTELVDAQSTELSTVTMALDGLEQLVMLLAEKTSGDDDKAGTSDSPCPPNLRIKAESAVARFKEQLATSFSDWLVEVTGRVGWPTSRLSGDGLDLLLLTCQSYRLFELICDASESGCVVQLARPIAAQFHFHFSCDRPTNRLDRPSWAFDFVLGTCEQHGDFFRELDELVNGQSFALFIDQLIGCLADRFRAQRDSILDSVLLPVVVEQIVQFGAKLSEQYGYDTATLQLLSIFLNTTSPETLDRWIELERARLADAWEDVRAALIDYGHFDRVLQFLQDHLQYLSNLRSPDLQTRLLLNVTIPMLEQLLHKIEFDVPAFVQRPPEAVRCCQILGAVDQLHTFLTIQWSEDLSILELSQSEPCRVALGYDASGRRGTVFWRAGEELQSLTAMLQGDKLYSYLRDGPMTLLARWAAAMHYSRTANPPQLIHDALRQALIDIPTRAGILKEHLPVPVFMPLFARFVRDLEDMIHVRLVLRNYFTRPGAEALEQDLETMDAVLHNIQTAPTDDGWIGQGRLSDCLILLKMPDDVHLKALLQADQLDEATALLEAAGVHHLTLSECEQVLASRHQ